MSYPVYRELFITYSLWLLFQLINFVFTSVRNFSWLLNGTYWRLLQNQKPENYEECAQVLTIVSKHHLDQFMEPTLSDYILVHERFENPEFVLRDDITLLTISDTQAIFVQNKKGATQPYLHNFVILGQWDACEKIITIPMNQFNKLAESMEDDGGKIIFLQNQSRCGGTLLTNVFLETGRCITFNEPAVMNALSKYIFVNPTWDKATEKRIFRNSIRMLCKPYNSLKGPTLAYVIKPTVTAILTTKVVDEYMPEASQIFLYREPVQVAISLRRLAQVLPTLKLMYYTPIIPGSSAPMLRFIGHTDVDFRGWEPTFDKTLELGFRIACISMHYYQKSRDAGIKITGMRYRDLVANRRSMIQQMFEVCGLPVELVSDAITALDKDSQSKTAFSRDKLAKLMPRPPKVNNAFLDAARSMAKDFKVKGPDCWEDSFRLAGSIIPK